LPIEFVITGGEIHDSKAASELITQLPAADAVVADKGYDSQAIRELIERRGTKAVIPRKSNSVIGNAGMDWALYGCRHYGRKRVCLPWRSGLSDTGANDRRVTRRCRGSKCNSFCIAFGSASNKASMRVIAAAESSNGCIT